MFQRLTWIAVCLFSVALCVPVARADEEAGFALYKAGDTSGWEQGVELNGEGYLEGGGRYLDKQFGDFVLRFEFRQKPGANSGIGIRAAREGDAAYVGMEIQVLEDSDPQYAGLHDYQFHGSIYGVVAAKRDCLKKPGEWNTEEIYAKGNHIRVTVNDKVIVDADIQEAAKNGTVDGREHPGLFNKEGYLVICGHGGGVEFKNMRIKELTGNE